MTCRRRARRGAALLAALALAACGSEAPGPVTPDRAAAPATPGTAAELAALLVPEVPSGLARVADADVDPPAGEKTIEDVANYADDPAYERAVLEDYGYRHGWERFWGTPGGTVTSVFVDQFETASGATAYAEDLARDGFSFYAGLLRHDPAELPDGCRLLTVEHPEPASGVTGPAAFAWCARGVFSVAVSAVADREGGTVRSATDEVTAVVVAQLGRLPG